MKIKHFLGLLLIGGVIGVIAYNVGANTNYLSSTQTTFTDLLSTKHQNQLKSTMRDSMINKLSHWAQNHETRLQTYAQSTTYPNLTNNQLVFTHYLSTKNNNILIAPMRDGLMGDFTNVITNHEMRLRCIQDGSCLKGQALVPPSVPQIRIDWGTGEILFEGTGSIGMKPLPRANLITNLTGLTLKYYSQNMDMLFANEDGSNAGSIKCGAGVICAYVDHQGFRVEKCRIARTIKSPYESTGCDEAPKAGNYSCKGSALLKLKATAKKIPVSSINCYYWQNNGQIIGGDPRNCPGSSSTRKGNTIEYAINYPQNSIPRSTNTDFRQRGFYHRGTFSRVDPDRTGKSPFCETTVQGSKIIVHIDKCKYRCYDIDFTRGQSATHDNYNTSHCDYTEERLDCTTLNEYQCGQYQKYGCIRTG